MSMYPYPSIEMMDKVMKNTFAEITALAAAGKLVYGRIYEVAGSGKLRVAKSATELESPIAYESSVDALAARTFDLEQGRLTIAAFNIFQQSNADALNLKLNTAVFNNYQQTVTDALAQKLDVNGTAVNSSKFDGKTYAEVKADWRADDAAQEARMLLALAKNVKSVYAVNFADGDAVNTTQLDVAAGVSFATLEDGKYMFIMNGTGTATASMTNYTGTDAAATHPASNNDHYLVTVAAGAMTSIAFRNDRSNEAISATNNSINVVSNRVTQLEAISATNGVAYDAVAKKYVLGGVISSNTTIGGDKYLKFDNVLVATQFVLIDDVTAEPYRFGIRNGKPYFGDYSLPN